MDIPDYGAALRALQELAPTAVIDSLAGVAQRAGAVDVVIYLVDFEGLVLTPLPSRAAHVEIPVGEAVLDSLAGQALRERRIVSQALPEGTRVWVPILEGSECTGVLALTLDADLDDDVRARCEELGMLAGCAISLAARSTDLFNLMRRRKEMSLPASMQWDLLPPLRLDAGEVISTGALEPAYDVGGDCFDHAVNGYTFDVAILDAMGHGLGSSLMSGLAVGTYRHARREGRSLATIHARLDEVLARQFAGESFVTGQIARLDLENGHLSWINAGHPAPLLVRAGRVVRELACRPSLPWGLGGPLEEQASDALEPGDAVLFYTDGVVEGRSPAGTPYGVDRLVDLVERTTASPQPPAAILRLLIHEVLDYQDRRLRDDATIVWVSWLPHR